MYLLLFYTALQLLLSKMKKRTFALKVRFFYRGFTFYKSESTLFFSSKSSLSVRLIRS